MIAAFLLSKAQEEKYEGKNGSLDYKACWPIKASPAL